MIDRIDSRASNQTICRSHHARLICLALILWLPHGTKQAACCESLEGSEERITIAGRAFLSDADALVELAQHTAHCVTCHDGAVGPIVASGMRRDRDSSKSETALLSTSASHEMPRANHPTNIEYPVADPEYVARDLLDPRIALEDGRVTCTSCHSRTQHEPAYSLAIPLSGSRLCLACHVK